MSEYLSAAELDELERLEKAATPGPWNVMYGKSLLHIETDYDCPYGAGLPVTSMPRTKEVDANLIADARNALPKLLAEVRALRDALKAARLSGY